MSEATSVETSPTIANLAEALSKAQGELKNPAKDAVNPHFKSRYADLATVRNAVFPVFSKHKLSVIQLPVELAAGPGLVTILAHSSGEYIRSSMLLRAVKSDPQGIGSAMTYARRYALQSVAGVAADDDDDGNAGSHAPTQQQAADAAAVAKHEQALRGSKTAAELETAGKLIGLDKTLTDEGRGYLRTVFGECHKRFPAKTANTDIPV